MKRKRKKTDFDDSSLSPKKYDNNTRDYYNPKNKILTRKFVQDVLFKITGLALKISNLELYQQAFVHNSVYKKDISPPKHIVARRLKKSEKSEAFFGTWNQGKPLIFRKTYESLEFMGDGWIGCIVGDYLYHRFKNQNEGFLTTLKNKLVKCETLAKLSTCAGLEDYILISKKHEKNSGRTNESVLEDVFEAFCGAIQQDLGLPVLQIFVKNIIEMTVDFNELIMNDDNYKDILLRYFQKNAWGNPTYSVAKEDGPPHKRIYTVGVDYFEILAKFNIQPMIVTEKGKFLALGMERSKKKAEQKAAKQVLDMLDMITGVQATTATVTV